MGCLADEGSLVVERLYMGYHLFGKLKNADSFMTKTLDGGIEP